MPNFEISPTYKFSFANKSPRFCSKQGRTPLSTADMSQCTILLFTIASIKDKEATTQGKRHIFARGVTSILSLGVSEVSVLQQWFCPAKVSSITWQWILNNAIMAINVRYSIVFAWGMARDKKLENIHENVWPHPILSEDLLLPPTHTFFTSILRESRAQSWQKCGGQLPPKPTPWPRHWSLPNIGSVLIPCRVHAREWILRFASTLR